MRAPRFIISSSKVHVVPRGPRRLVTYSRCDKSTRALRLNARAARPVASLSRKSRSVAKMTSREEYVSSRRLRKQRQEEEASSEVASSPRGSVSDESADEPTASESSTRSRRQRRLAADDAESDQISDTASSASDAASEPATSARSKRRNQRRGQRLEPTPEEGTSSSRRPLLRSERKPPVAARVPRIEGIAGLEVPPAFPDELADVERRLLDAPMALDDDDVYPDEFEPHVLLQPPAPSLGVAKDIYTEVLGGSTSRGFRRTAPSTSQSAAGAVPPDGARTERWNTEDPKAYEPQVTSRVFMIVMGLFFRASQGTLAGLCLMQLAVVPWFNPSLLVGHLSYAPIAMPLQRTMATMGALAFLGTCDQHVGAPRFRSSVALGLYGLCVISFVLQLPTDAAIQLGLEVSVTAALRRGVTVMVRRRYGGAIGASRWRYAGRYAGGTQHYRPHYGDATSRHPTHLPRDYGPHTTPHHHTSPHLTTTPFPTTGAP